MAEACYKDPYLPASYKGIAFDAMEVNSQHGRRGAEGEFPFGETTAYADMGRLIRTYSIAGRLATNDHVLRAAALIAVCETPGPGPLVHPTRGIIIVACKQLRVRDNPMDMQGVTEFDMDMVEAEIFPNGLSLVGQLLGLVLDPLIDALTESFNDDYHPETVTFYDRAAVVGTSQTAVQSISLAYGQAAKDEDNLNVYRSLSAYDTLSTDSGLLSQKKTLLPAMRDGMALVDKYGDSTDKQTLFRNLINQNTNSILVGRTGESSVNAVQTFMRALGAGYLARAILETQPKDMAEAFSQYDTVVGAFNQELVIAQQRCNSKLYVKLARFVEDVKKQLLDRAYNSPAVVEYQFASSVHSLVAAYQIMSDATQFKDIEQRNPYGWPWQVGPKVIAARAANG
jgi:prophage DNA circulation protein